MRTSRVVAKCCARKLKLARKKKKNKKQFTLRELLCFATTRRGQLLAERTGFEPAEAVNLARFPSVCLKPLDHLSICGANLICSNIIPNVTQIVNTIQANFPTFSVIVCIFLQRDTKKLASLFVQIVLIDPTTPTCPSRTQGVFRFRGSRRCSTCRQRGGFVVRQIVAKMRQRGQCRFC